MSRSIIDHTNRAINFKHPLRQVKITENGVQAVTVPCPSCHKIKPAKSLKVPGHWGYQLGFCGACYGNTQFQLILAQEYMKYVKKYGRPRTPKLGKTSRNGWETLTAMEELPCYQTFKKHMKALLGPKIRLSEIHTELALRYQL